MSWNQLWPPQWWGISSLPPLQDPGVQVDHFLTVMIQGRSDGETCQETDRKSVVAYNKIAPKHKGPEALCSPLRLGVAALLCLLLSQLSHQNATWPLCYSRCEQ